MLQLLFCFIVTIITWLYLLYYLGCADGYNYFLFIAMPELIVSIKMMMNGETICQLSERLLLSINLMVCSVFWGLDDINYM